MLWSFHIVIDNVFLIYNLVKRKKSKYIFLYTVSAFQLTINIFCMILFDNTGSYFDFSMLQLVSETSKFLNTITINYWYIA
jgi:hypothetical protein